MARPLDPALTRAAAVVTALGLCAAGCRRVEQPRPGAPPAAAVVRALETPAAPRSLAPSLAATADGITPRTRAIIPVHFAGQPADMAAIMRIAKKHRLVVIEDAAHAHGAM